ncbi:nucleotidyltransferase domain-containing protein [Peristeroidobacter agariperforans]|uniref:nucleotidyltransferase domain-containing protein n=1 Tax=Peristeroidobacter agariperforans TaxID=268404 RepID=UPI00101D7E97|nr:hypothetical protein [Peristeroidobacter agariperforans]
MDALAPVCNILAAYLAPWWIAGGWALDLHRGASHRAHQDIDVAVLRRDQQSLRQFLSGWSVHKMVDGQQQPWTEPEELALPIHEVHAERNGTRLELLLNEASQTHWQFRRNPSISLPLSAMSRRTTRGIPYLCPQVVLLYKAKNPRTKDQDDFEQTLPTLPPADRLWLAQALEVCHPGHAWLRSL